MKTQSSVSLQFVYIGLGVTFATSLAALLLILFQPSEKVVYVETAKLIAGYQGMADARKSLEAKALVWRGQLDTLRQELETLSKNQSAQNSSLSAKEKVLNDQIFHSKKLQLENYQQTLMQQAKSEEGKAIESVLQKINIFLEGYGKKHGYKIILAATDYGNVAYADKTIDVTADALKELNADYGR